MSKGFKSGQNLNVNVNVNVNENDLLDQGRFLTLEGSKHQCNEPSSSSKHKNYEPSEEFKTTENCDPLEGQNSTVVNEPIEEVKTTTSILDKKELSWDDVAFLLMQEDLNVFIEEDTLYNEDDGRMWKIV